MAGFATHLPVLRLHLDRRRQIEDPAEIVGVPLDPARSGFLELLMVLAGEVTGLEFQLKVAIGNLKPSRATKSSRRPSLSSTSG